jgi:alkaline phosphatase
MVTRTNTNRWVVTRRDFLRASGVALAALPMLRIGGVDAAESTPIRFGMVTDCHYADRESAGTRHYRESLEKLAECVDFMNAQNVDFLIELGDMKDQAAQPDESQTLDYLQQIEGVFARFGGPRYHVLGNHDMDSISKTQFMAHAENTGIPADQTYYSFDAKGIHYVVLDANYTSAGADYDHGNFDWTDANIPGGQLDWLRGDLEKAELPVVVFCHQRLDGAGDLFVNNAEPVRAALEASGKVLGVFHGHHHAGDYSLINGIHYYTLIAVVEGAGFENSAYAIIEIDSESNITVTGYRQAESKELEREAVVHAQ